MKGLIVFILMCLPFLAKAELFGDRSRFGFEAQGFTNSNSFVQGGIIGFHAARYFDYSNVHYGFSLLTGSRFGGSLSTDNLTYGGFQLGYDRTALQIFHLETDLLVGYGFGSGRQGATIQPSVGLGLIVVNGWRAVFTIGYLYTPMTNVSGMTFGIKLDRKTFDDGFGYNQ